MDVIEIAEDSVPPANPLLKLDLSKSLGFPIGSATDAVLQPRNTNKGMFDKFAFQKAEKEKAVAAQGLQQAGQDAGAWSPQVRLGRKRKAQLIDSDDYCDEMNLTERKALLVKASEKPPKVESSPEDALPSQNGNADEAEHRKEPPRVGMKVEVDLTGEGPTEAELLEDLEEKGQVLEVEQVDAVLQRCEEISNNLRQQLGGQKSERYNAVETGQSNSLVGPAELTKACGDAARYLKPYQLVGINFLMLLARSGVSGAILADEMGLGKTAQAICFLGALKALEGDPGPHLVVAPASLLENWERELKRWCPGLAVVSYYGKDRERLRYDLSRHLGGGQDGGSDEDDEGEEEEEEWEPTSGSKAPLEAGTKEGGPRRPPPFNVMLTGYALFERTSIDQQLDRKFLRKWRWSHIVLDEAHAVKNRNASRTMRLNKIARNCKRRILLTGTPLQNDLEELQNLLQFMLPDIFGKEDSDALADVQDEAALVALTERMQAVLGPFVLRRLKSEVAQQLTAKKHVVRKLEMAPDQAGLYAAAVAELRSQISSKAAKAADPSRFVKAVGKQKVANAFAHLRKIAQHPLLVRTRYTDDALARIAKVAHRQHLFGGGASLARVREELQGYSDHQLHCFCQDGGQQLAGLCLPDDAIMNSGKFQELAELLPQLHQAGSRPLIFSQWTTVLDLVEWLLDRLQLHYVRLDGNTAVPERLALVDQFNNPSNGIFCFLLSTRAGGQGLNLTGADTVILHDVDFNPQVDKQAEDRAHRLGQTKEVTVHRLVSTGTVDDAIYAISQRKLRLDAAVLDGVTATGAGGKADGGSEPQTETAAMGQLLQTLLYSSDKDSANVVEEIVIE